MIEKQTYKILLNDRYYKEWLLYDALSLNEIDKINIDPVLCKLFSCDIFEYNENIDEFINYAKKLKL